MRTTLLALPVLLVLTSAIQAPAQNRNCLHGPDETRADRIRREKAVELAHEINGAEGMTQRFNPRRGSGAYVPLDQLSNVPAAPNGFRVQLHTDGTSYTFSIKDMMDPCLYGVFSDQSGDVYEGTPGPRLRVKLLSEK